MTAQPTIVQKYGGSSLANNDALLAVAQAIVARHNQGVRLVVVVSAMGDTTDGLLAKAHALTAHPHERELDMLVTAGERISMALLTMAVAALGGRAKSLTGSQSGIITENAHQGARIIAVRPHRIQALLDEGYIAIVAGYQGVSLDHEITTLGRGGSDTTAVALGAALGAQAIDIFSDVDGVYTADPRVCSQARHLPQVSPSFMANMAHFGAQVLHPQAVAFAERAGIALYARATRTPVHPKTRLHNAVVMPEGAWAVSLTEEVLWLHAPAEAMLWQALLACEERGLQVVVVGGSDALCVWQKSLGQLQGPALADECAEVAVVFVAAVTLTLGQAPTAALGQRALQTCRDNGIVVHGLYMGAISITLAVDPASAARAVGLVHALGSR